MDIFSIKELSEVIRHVEIEGQGGIFTEETGKLPKDYPKEFLSRIVNYISDRVLIEKIDALTEDEALHMFVKSVYIVRIKHFESTNYIEENAIIEKVFEDYIMEPSALK
ncbi:hypothetical protein ABER75_26290 [Niallia taxi]|uniref:Uncharacterized protein n=1 Tax=Niallia taxi TaxID=2499688 RepID=A0A437KF45_9BACI|nr:hypothetical protein [Niallia taxi]MCM3215706.1 hypothetical protein [Niallia taxi]MDK8641763.1 hypothetical protein [Niallia taxi]MED4038522.1 hypothetical protein [Niallia taxi]MED4056685.1 hypothetical protein [Niallia taxi]MED4117400.1 hypothetical protein [Niallia taxi]